MCFFFNLLKISKFSKCNNFEAKIVQIRELKTIINFQFLKWKWKTKVQFQNRVRYEDLKEPK